VAQTLSLGACTASSLAWDQTPNGRLRARGTSRCLTLLQADPVPVRPPSAFLAACEDDPAAQGQFGAGQRWELRQGSLASLIPNPIQPGGYCLGVSNLTASDLVVPVACDASELKWRLSDTTSSEPGLVTVPPVTLVTPVTPGNPVNPGEKDVVYSSTRSAAWLAPPDSNTASKTG
jgi:hypothetical protein